VTSAGAMGYAHPLCPLVRLWSSWAPCSRSAGRARSWCSIRTGAPASWRPVEVLEGPQQQLRGRGSDPAAGASCFRLPHSELTRSPMSLSK
jgi:hypothetical protein